MKIALVVCGSLNTVTGGYIYDRMMVDHLRRRGHGVEVISLAGATYAGRLSSGFWPGLARMLAQVSCDVMIQDALAHPALWLVNRYRARRPAFPRIALAHMVLSAQPRQAWRNRCFAAVEKAFYRSVDGCIANSATTMSHLARWGMARRPFLVATPGGDRLGHALSRQRVVHRAMAPGPLALLFLGNVLPGKGLLPLIDALAGIPDVQWRLSVAGSLTMDPDHVREVRADIRRRGIHRRVRLLGALTGEDLVRQLARSHLLVMPFSHEGFGMAFIEGMAFGLPAVASSRGAARETVTTGVNGFLVPPEHPGAAAAAVERLAADRHALARMALSALDTFHRHAPWSATFGSIEGFLLKVAGQ